MIVDDVLVLSILAGVIGVLAFTRIAADAVLGAALTAVLVVPVPPIWGNPAWSIGLLSPSEALTGFANPGVAAIGALFIVVAGLRETGGVDWLAHRVLGRPGGLKRALVRIVAPVTSLSAFLNNTPVVAMLIPAIEDWSRRLDLPASKLLIPLSYAAILGGMCTLIGTSTNLVVAGLVLAEEDLEPIGMFDVALVGLPAAALGAVYLVLVAPKLLPGRAGAGGVLGDPRQYTAEMIVPEGSALAGKTIEAAGLRHLPGCFLVEIDRPAGDPDAPAEVMAAVGPEQVLREGDRLVFAGVVEAVRDLQKLRGLEPATDQVFKLGSPRYRRRLFEAVVGAACPNVGRSIRAGRFRSVYNAAVLAVARNGERVRGKIGDIVLRPGDTLLIEAHQDFLDQQRHSKHFLLISAIEDSTPRRHGRAPVALLVLVAMVAAVTAGWLSMLQAALAAAGVMVLSRCCTVSEGRQSIDWSVLLVIGAALGLGRALDETGAAQTLASGVLGLAGSNPVLALAAIYLVTALLTETITNNAAVALTFPIALTVADRLGVEPWPFIFAIMIAGSASFITPLGYQTNLMVYGPGGYRFTDFVRAGAPLAVIVAVVTLVLAPAVYGF